MILTVTPSPAIDWTVAVDSFDLDLVNRITESVREPSGKGVNVSWALHRAGIATTAAFPSGGGTGRFMTEALATAGIPHLTIDSGQEVRTNITLVSPGHSTKINEAGPPITGAQLDALTRRVLAAAEAARVVLICGSLPPGAHASYPAELVAALKGRGIAVVVDTSGEPLKLAVPSGPDLIKPNVHELAELTAQPIATFGQVVLAARQVIADGAGAVLASLGADGAIYVDGATALVASAAGIPFVNSVGAGDALLAGFVSQDAEPAKCLFNAVLWASSAVAHPTTLFPIRSEFASRIQVTELADADRPLTEPSLPLVIKSTKG